MYGDSSKESKDSSDKIRVIDSKENLRQGGARNLGLQAARGEYIGYVDADDFVSPKMYELLFNKAEESQADATFIQYTSIDENSKFSEDAKKRGFLDRFWRAYEWGYTFRYAINTCSLYLHTQDDIDIQKISFLSNDLKTRFPKWYQNPYFKSETLT